MLIYIIINIAIISASILIDMYLQSNNQVKLSTILIAVSINSVINLIVIGKFDFISHAMVAFILIWTLLALLTDRKFKPITFKTQKFMAFIVFTLLSLSLFIVFNTSEKSYYMSVPYLAPVFFIIGASFIFLTIFQSSEDTTFRSYFMKSKPKSLTIGTLLIIISFLVMNLLTPFWYVYLIIYLILILFILWTKPFYKNFD